MQRSHQIGLPVYRAVAGSFLTASLLVATPFGASAGEGRDRSTAASEEQGSTRHHGGEPSERVADTPAAERARGAAASEPGYSPAGTSSPVELPVNASGTSTAAATASREPSDTSEVVLVTTPADPSAEADTRSVEDLAQTIITADQPIPMGDVNAAGSVDPALRPMLRVIAAAGPTSVPTSSPGGLLLDPLVPVSLGLLLLARALRRQPPPDDRTYSL